jgi:hypothetical protein
MKTGDMQIHLPEMNTRLWVSILVREMSHVNSLSKPFTIHVNAQFAGDVVWVVFGHRIMSIYWVIAPWR